MLRSSKHLKHVLHAKKQNHEINVLKYFFTTLLEDTSGSESNGPNVLIKFDPVSSSSFGFREKPRFLIHN